VPMTQGVGAVEVVLSLKPGETHTVMLLMLQHLTWKEEQVLLHEIQIVEDRPTPQ
jgi:hypothetical protein